MIMKIRKMLLCVLLIHLFFISLSFVSHAAACSNNWLRPSSQTMENEIMSASMTEYANIERYLSIKQGWKTTHVYFLQGVLLVKGLDDDEIKYDDIFWLPMVFMQGGVLSKAFPQGPCSITQKTPIALTEAEGEVVPTSQGIIGYNYTLTGKQNVKHFKGVMNFNPQEAAPSDDTVVKGFKIVDRSKPYMVIGSKDMPVTTLGELRRALIEKKNSSKKWTGPIPEIVMAPEEKGDTINLKELYPFRLEQTYGFVDKKGRVVVETPCIFISDFYDDIAMCTNKYEGYINREGKVIVEPKYSSQDHSGFSEGLAAVKENGKFGYIDKTGNFVIKPQFENFPYPFKNGLAAIQRDKKWGFIDKTGKIVIEPKFDNVGYFSEGLAAAYVNGKYGWTYGFINETGDWVIEPQFFKQPSGFASGLSAIEKDGKWGFIDKSGKFIIEPQFDGAGGFKNGVATGRKNEKTFLIDKSGQIFVYRDKVCGRNVIKNGKGEITWPRNIFELCAQAIENSSK